MAGMRAGASLEADRGAMLRRQHDVFHKRIDRHCDDLLGNIEQLVAAAKVAEQPNNDQHVFQLDVIVANMVTAAQSLLSVIAELKLNALMQDFSAINEEVAQEQARLRTSVHTVQTELGRLNNVVEVTLRQLEQHAATSTGGLNLV